MVNGIYGLDTASACSLPIASRYELQVRESARMEAVWALWSGERWFAFTDSQGREVVPIWPGQEYADAFADTLHPGFKPRRMSLDYWMNNFVTSIMNRNCLVSVFPAPGDLGKVVTPSHILMDVRAESDAYGY